MQFNFFKLDSVGLKTGIWAYDSVSENGAGTSVSLFSCVDRFSLNGDLLFTASSDGAIFVMDGRPSKNFAMLGYVCKWCLCHQTWENIKLSWSVCFVSHTHSKNGVIELWLLWNSSKMPHAQSWTPHLTLLHRHQNWRNCLRAQKTSKCHQYCENQASYSVLLNVISKSYTGYFGYLYHQMTALSKTSGAVLHVYDDVFLIIIVTFKIFGYLLVKNKCVFWTGRYCAGGWLGSQVVSVLDSGAEGPRFKSQLRLVTVLGKLFTPIVPLFTKQQNW